VCTELCGNDVMPWDVLAERLPPPRGEYAQSFTCKARVERYVKAQKYEAHMEDLAHHETTTVDDSDERYFLADF